MTSLTNDPFHTTEFKEHAFFGLICTFLLSYLEYELVNIQAIFLAKRTVLLGTLVLAIPNTRY